MAANLSPSKKRKQLVLDLVATLIVLLLALLVVLPIWWIFRSSLMSTAKLNEYPPSFIPHEWLWANYSKALETFEYWRYFRNTFSIIIPAVTFGTVTAIFCGYAFARLRFRGKKLIFNICVGTILLPSMVTLLPLYVVWTKGLGLGDTYWPLILPYLTGGGFFNIFLIRQFLMTIPKELDEAASIDGAGRMRILWTILVPSIKPAVVVVAMISQRKLEVVFNNSMFKTLFNISGTDELYRILRHQLAGSTGSDVHDNPAWYRDLYLRTEEFRGRYRSDRYEELTQPVVI